MRQIKELLNIVTKKRVGKVDVIGSKKSNAYVSVIKAINTGQIKTDRDMSVFLDISESDSRFRVFKNRLKNRIFNQFLLFDVDRMSLSAHGKAQYECSLNIHVIRTLLSMGARSMAMQILNKTLPKAIKYDLTKTVLYCSLTLRSHTSYLGKIKEYDKINKLYLEYIKKNEAEDRLIEMFERAVIPFMGNNPNINNYKKMLKDFVSEANEYRNKYNTYTLNLYYYRIKGISDFVNYNFQSAIKNWKSFEKYHIQKPDFYDGVYLGEASLNLLSCYLHLRDYKKGEKCVEKCRKFFPNGVNNWFYFMEFYFLLAMQSGKYNKAGEILEEVTKQDEFKTIFETSQEKWVIFREYYNFIMSIKSPDKQFKHNFKKAKFINETPIFVKDKIGYNITILVLQIIFNLIEGHYDVLTEKTYAIKRYMSRYLDSEEMYRSRLFLKMILSAVKHDYDYNKIIIATKSDYNKLRSAGMSYKGNMDGMEVIPFETLWMFALRHLKKSKKKLVSV